MTVHVLLVDTSIYIKILLMIAFPNSMSFFLVYSHRHPNE